MLAISKEQYLQSEYVNMIVTANTMKLPQFSMQVTLHANIRNSESDKLIKCVSSNLRLYKCAEHTGSNSLFPTIITSTNLTLQCEHK